ATEIHGVNATAKHLRENLPSFELRSKHRAVTDYHPWHGKRMQESNERPEVLVSIDGEHGQVQSVRGAVTVRRAALTEPFRKRAQLCFALHQDHAARKQQRPRVRRLTESLQQPSLL